MKYIGHLLLSKILLVSVLCGVVIGQETEAEVELQKAHDKVNKWRGHVQQGFDWCEDDKTVVHDTRPSLNNKTTSEPIPACFPR